MVYILKYTNHPINLGQIRDFALLIIQTLSSFSKDFSVFFILQGVQFLTFFTVFVCYFSVKLNIA